MMACMNGTFAFSQSHFASPVGAEFGYAEVQLVANSDSPSHQLPPSPSARFQPSPQPFLLHPPPASPTPALQAALQDSDRSEPTIQIAAQNAASLKPTPKTAAQNPASPKSTLHTDPQSPASPKPALQTAAWNLSSPSPALQTTQDNPASPNPIVQAAPNLTEALPPGLSEAPRVEGSASSSPFQPQPEHPQTALRDSAEEETGKEEKSEPDIVPGDPQTDPPTKAETRDPPGSGVDRACQVSESLPVSRKMGDSAENKSPRSSTSDNLQTLSLKEHYEVERELGRGTYGKVVLARCRHTGTQVALKLLPKTSTKLRDFQREFQLSYFLSPHASIIDTYNVAFETRSSYVFAQEHAPLGDLFDAIPPQLGMREADAKSVVKQLSSALDFMHSKHLVHRDIKPENVLVMATDFSRVKLMDFGMTRKHGAMVRKTSGSIPYTPPEVCEAVRNENILVSASADVWALAVLLFCMLTGNFPWENADIGDVYFKEFVLWQRRKTTKLPSQWRRFTPRAMKFFRKALDVKPERRCEIGEIHKYLSDTWTQKSRTNDSDEDTGSSASGEHMDELATMLQDHGIETRVDRRLRERRISEWLLSL